MIYLTGDTHGGIDGLKLHKSRWPAQQGLTKSDYLIILGDFGGIWSENDRELIELLDSKNFTTLTILGNHENYDLIERLPITQMFGGNVRVVSPSVTILMNGQVYEINGNTFFVMGGAYSIDKPSRRTGISWWPQEIPNYSEVEEGFKNLKRYNNKVDYVLTHTCPTDMAEHLYMTDYDDPTNRILDAYKDILDYKMWFFGHMHIDRRYGKYRAMYNTVKELGV